MDDNFREKLDLDELYKKKKKTLMIIKLKFIIKF